MERKKHKRPLNWSIYLLRVLKQVHPGQAISTNAITVVNDMLWDVYNRIMRESENLLIVSKKSTIDARCIQTAVRLTIPGELAKHAVSEGIKSISKRCGCIAREDHTGHVNIPKPVGPKPKIARTSRSTRAGLVFPIGRIERKMRESTRHRVGGNAGGYLAAVLEYLAAEILELAGNAARDSCRKRITPRNVMLAVRNDSELNEMFGNYIIAFAGVFPIISVYFPTKVKSQVDNANNTNTSTVANTTVLLPSFNVPKF
jgi:histone H2A